MTDAQPAGWCVAVVDKNADETVARAVAKAGFEVYVARYRKILVGVRIKDGRRVRTRGLGEIVERLLIPGYVFVKLRELGDERQLLSVDSAILRLLRSAPHRVPSIVADDKLEEFKIKVNSGKFDDKATMIGKSVRIITADNATLIGDLIEVGAGGLAEVAVEILGRKVKTTVPADRLTLAD